MTLLLMVLMVEIQLDMAFNILVMTYFINQFVLIIYTNYIDYYIIFQCHKNANKIEKTL